MLASLTQTPTLCPTPDKGRCATQEAARGTAQRMRLRIGRLLTPYACVCGWWHLATTQPLTLPADAEAAPTDVGRLHGLKDAEFRALVTDEARGQAQTPDRLALRHPSTLARWQRMLTELHDDLTDQLARRSEENTPGIGDWRRRARRYGQALTERAHECRALLAQLPRDTGQPTQKDLRRLAGEKAIDRLIAAHGTEFAGYLAQEYAELGADLPQRVAKYLPADAAA
ncbi:hypothetical protein ACGFN1_37575 [Streptomyces sp. NPDC048685]|uniref:hypothetical protein n=1 Tax=Streptomyces sp. NPDC048685 TaxID=3365584 RepID=UPI003720683A